MVDEEFEELVKQLRELRAIDNQMGSLPLVDCLEMLISSYENAEAKRALCVYNLRKLLTSFKSQCKLEHPELKTGEIMYGKSQEK